MNNPLYCNPCNGDGFFLNGSFKDPCKQCNGTGIDAFCKCGHHYGDHSIFDRLREDNNAICWGIDCNCKSFNVSKAQEDNMHPLFI